MPQTSSDRLDFYMSGLTVWHISICLKLSSWDTYYRNTESGVAESKVTAIREARRPQTVSEVKSFMGLVNFTGRFIPNLATLGEPLNRLMKKEQPFVWGKEQDAAFVK
jgi:hypothetical protein